MAILEITNLSYDYITKAGRVHAVKDATASFDTGIVYAIVGRSGSGKSTLMSLMAGLDVPKAGKSFMRAPILLRSTAIGTAVSMSA